MSGFHLKRNTGLKSVNLAHELWSVEQSFLSNVSCTFYAMLHNDWVYFLILFARMKGDINCTVRWTNLTGLVCFRFMNNSFVGISFFTPVFDFVFSCGLYCFSLWECKNSLLCTNCHHLCLQEFLNLLNSRLMDF